MHIEYDDFEKLFGKTEIKGHPDARTGVLQDIDVTATVLDESATLSNGVRRQSCGLLFEGKGTASFEKSPWTYEVRDVTVDYGTHSTRHIERTFISKGVGVVRNSDYEEGTNKRQYSSVMNEKGHLNLSILVENDKTKENSFYVAGWTVPKWFARQFDYFNCLKAKKQYDEAMAMLKPYTSPTHESSEAKVIPGATQAALKNQVA